MNRFERISGFSFSCVPKTREVFRLNYFIASKINLLSQLLVPTEVTDECSTSPGRLVLSLILVSVHNFQLIFNYAVNIILKADYHLCHFKPGSELEGMRSQDCAFSTPSVSTMSTRIRCLRLNPQLLCNYSPTISAVHQDKSFLALSFCGHLFSFAKSCWK